MKTCLGEVENPIAEIKRRGFEDFYEDGGHFWLNTQLDRKGPVETCTLCLKNRPAKEIHS